MEIAVKQLSNDTEILSDANLASIYYYAWTQLQAKLLRSGQLQLIDIYNLAEEIEDIGRAERLELGKGNWTRYISR
ncbi:MAG: hypothetical protein AUK48_10835 [Oscillatoriales cyanobacterium CG2_30_44_21]|nr:MAG: hypothetical protein AUK48_10835 [Oscillatoriales cyanobacterium CG2_30_44_21]